MKKIQIKGKRGNGLYAIVDDKDYDFLNKYKWFISAEGYVNANVLLGERRITFKMHQLVVVCRKNYVIDHINRNKLDNRRENIRIVSRLINSWNRGPNKDNKLGYKGVEWVPSKQRYRAKAKLARKVYHFGDYTNLYDAVKAYNIGAVKLFGEYAYINPLLAINNLISK